MKTCPIATHDVKVNLANRDKAFKQYGYGPANPEMENSAFWNDKANEWQTDLKQAKSMRCGNCSAFIQTSKMLECITNGIDDDKEGFAKDVVESAQLGYCELFDFKCAAERTCSAWLVGGPITDDNSQEVDDAPFRDSLED